MYTIVYSWLAEILRSAVIDVGKLKLTVTNFVREHIHIYNFLLRAHMLQSLTQNLS